MKVETPQLRWHQIINPNTKKDAGANGPILSCSLLSINASAGVLATAGNTEVNLWKVGFTEDAARLNVVGKENDEGGRSSHILVQPKTSSSSNASSSNNNNNNKDDSTNNKLNEHTRIQHIVTLSRGTNECGINAVKFSPSGLKLVAAGDGGTVVVWSIPQGGDTKFWTSAERETDLPLKILFNQSNDVMDVAWSADSKRFTVCSLDHTMVVWEHSEKDGEWRIVHRSAKDHTHYIQGVAYDPKGVYLASMGSDRMVKVYARKNMKDGAVKGEMAKYAVAKDDNSGDQQEQQQEEDQKTILQSQVLPELLTNSTFALQNKIKTMKFLNPPTAKPNADNDNESSSNKESANANNNNANATTPSAKRHHMFADELTLGSFFRRLAFTPDGAFLVVPAAMWHGSRSSTTTAAVANVNAKNVPGSPTCVANSEKLSESSFATYLFARHNFDQPCKVLTGLDKPSVVVRPNPVLFQLPPNAKPSSLPYRSVFAVLTSDTVLLYDTHHSHPLAMARGLHYAGLTDATWSEDGKTLFVTSSDGYVSILSFGNGELGDVYVAKDVKIVQKVEENATAEVVNAKLKQPESSGAVINTLVPKKKNKLKLKEPESSGAVINTLVPKKKKAQTSPPPSAGDSSESSSSEGKKVTFSQVNQVKQIEPRQPAVIVNTLVGKKKKKKIAPTLVTPAQQQQTQNSGEKRSIEEAPAAAPLQENGINILVPKKKKKVLGSSTPVPTS